MQSEMLHMSVLAVLMICDTNCISRKNMLVNLSERPFACKQYISLSKFVVLSEEESTTKSFWTTWVLLFIKAYVAHFNILSTFP